jgi:hypothetical protein
MAAPERTKKDPWKILAIGEKFLSSGKIYSRVFRHPNMLLCVAGASFCSEYFSAEFPTSVSLPTQLFEIKPAACIDNPAVLLSKNK